MESTVVSLPLMMALAYAALMFGGAALVHRHRHYLHGSIWRTFAYTLALAVYCTSWTYFGAVGSAATSGWDYLPIYLGPMLLMTFGGGFLHRLNQEVHRDGATSIADFIGSRFGKSRSVAALVTIIALFGTIPYIALQLRSVVLSFALVSGTPESSGLLLGAAAVLALFAIIFGAWRYQIVGENEAILFAVAFESIVKLVAMFLVAGLAFWLFRTVPEAQVVAGMERFRAGFDWGRLDMDFAVTTALSALTILCLPRNFFVCVMEARDPGDILRARWGFIVYLLLTVLAVLPIAAAGSAMLPGTTRPDLYVLSLPQHFGFSNLALFIFLGGLSAAVAMIVTETVAVSSMISNDLFAPLLLRRSMGDGHMGERLLWIRRSAIIALVAAAVIYALWTPSTTQLASVGLVAFVAIAQCGPALILAVYRPHNDAVAARAGLVTGFVLWLVLLFLPAINGASLNHDTHWLPLPGFGQINSFTYGTILSLGGNVAAYLLLSARKVRRADLVGRFIGQRGIPPIATVGALRDLVVRFVGEEATREAFGSDAERTMPVDRASARGAERLIGSVVGASSARAIMASAMSGQGVGLADVAQLLDASGQSLHFSQGLLAATLENIDVGVSVIDRDLRLIAWNSRYLELFHYPSGLVRVGVPVAELIRCNAERGDCGPGEVEDHVARRLGHMRTRHQHSFERHRADGRVIKTVGGPMPDGGYVMSFTDITLEARARTATENARRDLERAVEDRTTELSEANRKLAIAIADKTRFLAAASHDLLQPLHAALLFSAALRRRLDDEQARSMLSRLDRSIEAANDLLRALLDISKLDAGGIRASPSRFSVRAALVDLVDNFQPLAAEKGLRLVVGPGDGWVEVDRTLLRSIMQNFLSNAIRYTERGGVLVAARRRGALLRLEVYDTGVGIPPNKIDAVFREFERLGHSGEAGIGLGLAIVERSAPLVGGRIDVRSVPGRGSRFALVLPSAPALAKGNEGAPLLPMSHAPAPRQLLVVDDDATNRLAMQSVLRELGHGCVVAGSVTAALDVAGPLDGALVDYHLGDGQNGIAVIEALRFARPGLAVALVTAERDQAVLDDARQRGIAVLAKPLGLAVLDQWIADMGEGTVKAPAPPP